MEELSLQFFRVHYEVSPKYLDFDYISDARNYADLLENAGYVNIKLTVEDYKSAS